jgi:hypothetical protein
MSISYEEAREWAIDRATDWALDDDGGERLTIGGLRPAWALRIEAFNRLMPIATKAAGIPSDFGGGGVRQTLKDRGWDRAVRLLSLRAVAALRPGSRPTIDARTGGPAPVAFLHELATPSGSEPMLAVAAALPKGSYRPIVVDARTARAWQRLGEPAAATLLPWREERSILRAARTAADRNWTRLAHDPRRFRIGDADVTIAAMQTLEPLARRSLPWLAVESLALARQLDRIRPSRLIIASDQHRWGRLGVAAAAERGIHTLVLQHGLPQYRLGFLPVVADAVATWSAESDAWLSAGGAPADRLIRFGNPRLDRFARLSRR